MTLRGPRIRHAWLQSMLTQLMTQQSMELCPQIGLSRSSLITGPSATRDGVALMRENLAHDPVATQTMGVAALDHLRGVSVIDVGADFRQGAFNKQLGALEPRLNSLVDPKTSRAASDAW